MNPCSILALLIPKNDNTIHMCVNIKAINKLKINYRYPIPILYDMLDELHGSCVFSKVDLCCCYR